MVTSHKSVPNGAQCMGNAIRTWSAVCSAAPHIVHRRTESPNTSPQAIELNPSCSDQAHLNRPGTSRWYKNKTEAGSFLRILHVPFIINSYTQKRGCRVWQG